MQPKIYILMVLGLTSCVNSSPMYGTEHAKMYDNNFPETEDNSNIDRFQPGSNSENTINNDELLQHYEDILQTQWKPLEDNINIENDQKNKASRNYNEDTVIDEPIIQAKYYTPLGNEEEFRNKAPNDESIIIEIEDEQSLTSKELIQNVKKIIEELQEVYGMLPSGVHEKESNSHNTNNYQKQEGNQKNNQQQKEQNIEENSKDALNLQYPNYQMQLNWLSDQPQVEMEDLHKQITQDLGQIRDQAQEIDDFGQQQTQDLGQIRDQALEMDDFGQQQAQDLGVIRDEAQEIVDFGQQKTQDLGQIRDQAQEMDDFGQQQTQNSGQIILQAQEIDDFRQDQSQDLTQIKDQTQDADWNHITDMLLQDEGQKAEVHETYGTRTVSNNQFSLGSINRNERHHQIQGFLDELEKDLNHHSGVNQRQATNLHHSVGNTEIYHTTGRESDNTENKSIWSKIGDSIGSSYSTAKEKVKVIYSNVKEKIM